MAPSRPHETSPLPLEPRSFPERLRWLRKQHGLTQVDLAQILGCDQAMISSWEVGRTRPSAVALGVLGRHYGVSLASLETGAGFLGEAGNSLAQARAARGASAPGGVLAVNLPPTGGGQLLVVDAMSGTQVPMDAAEGMSELLRGLKAGRQAWVVLR